MARISGVELQDKWRSEYALTKIKGLGFSSARKILDSLKIDRSKKVEQLSPDEVAKITSAIEKYSTEGELLRTVRANITRLQRIGAYRGIRHSRGLPSRGQRTRRNARTKRGKRKTVGAFKKDVLAKQTQQQK